MFHFPDSDTGYYDTETAFERHERELEVAALEREDRLEAQAEEMHSIMWAVEDLIKRPRTALNDNLEDAFFRQSVDVPSDESLRNYLVRAIAQHGAKKVSLGVEAPTDPETGCTAAEMKEEEVNSVLPIEPKSSSQPRFDLRGNRSEGRVA
jgi:hypothetical protein